HRPAPRHAPRVTTAHGSAREVLGSSEDLGEAGGETGGVVAGVHQLLGQFGADRHRLALGVLEEAFGAVAATHTGGLHAPHGGVDRRPTRGVAVVDVHRARHEAL